MKEIKGDRHEQIQGERGERISQLDRNCLRDLDFTVMYVICRETKENNTEKKEKQTHRRRELTPTNHRLCPAFVLGYQ